MERNSRGSVFESVQDRKSEQQQQQNEIDASEAVVEETTLFRFQNNNGATRTKCASHVSHLVILAVIPVLTFVIKRFL